MNAKPITVLAGDIGGTKTNLALYTTDDGGTHATAAATYVSQDASDLEEMIADLLQKHPAAVAAACFGIACPVMDGKCQPTNLAWAVSEKKLRQQFGWPQVQILNDLTTTAIAVPHLDGQALFTLNLGRAPQKGNLALVAPGTGMGQALLLYDGGRYLPMASEGGHADFAPADPDEIALWQFLHLRFGHVSVERVLSGQGLVNIFDWLAATSPLQVTTAVRQAMADSDPAQVITLHAINGSDSLCRQALMRFCRILGSVAGNLALTGLATGGVFLGGGIPPKILSILKTSEFMASFTAKGRFSDFLAAIPVYVICDDKAALIGAGQRALELAVNIGVNHDHK